MNFLSGAVGGAAVVMFLGKQWLDLRLKKSLAKFDFLLENRSKCYAAILASMGKVISASREISNEIRWLDENYQQVSHSIVELEDDLRPSLPLLDKKLYDQIHEFKTAARFLRKEYFFHKTSNDQQNSHSVIIRLAQELEGKRDAIIRNIPRH